MEASHALSLCLHRSCDCIRPDFGCAGDQSRPPESGDRATDRRPGTRHWKMCRMSLLFSATSPLVLILALTQRAHRRVRWKLLGHVVGWSAIVVGLTGVILHLESSFFYERTIRSLTYSPPFAAPLAYIGLGFLLVMNRMVDAESVEWARWILLFTMGGFIGNFTFSLADHAGNGFFFAVEWVPVAASAVAIGFLCVAVLTQVSRWFIDVSAAILIIEAAVGLWGFALHTMG